MDLKSEDCVSSIMRDMRLIMASCSPKKRVSGLGVLIWPALLISPALLFLPDTSMSKVFWIEPASVLPPIARSLVSVAEVLPYKYQATSSARYRSSSYKPV